MNIVIKTIPHDEQTYDTSGNWWFDGDTLEIRVSKMGCEHYEFLVATHELHEAMLCHFRGITAKQVDNWDLAWKAPKGVKGPAIDEAGDDPKAPYYKEHRFGIAIERLVAHELNANWAEYDAAFDRLPKWLPKWPKRKK
jgi:hypothetical protein